MQLYRIIYYLLSVGIVEVLEHSHDTSRQQHTCVIPEAVNTVKMLR